MKLVTPTTPKTVIFRLGAEQGDAEAQYAYANGWGVPEDDAEGVKWLRKAAEQGHANAQDRLEDEAKAMRWNKAAEQEGERMVKSSNERTLKNLFSPGDGNGIRLRNFVIRLRNRSLAPTVFCFRAIIR